MGKPDKISPRVPHRERFWRAKGDGAEQLSTGWECRLGIQQAGNSAGCSLPSRTEMGFSTSQHPREPRWRRTAHTESRGSELQGRKAGITHPKGKCAQKTTCPCTAGLESHGRRDKGGKQRGEQGWFLPECLDKEQIPAAAAQIILTTHSFPFPSSLWSSITCQDADTDTGS